MSTLGVNTYLKEGAGWVTLTIDYETPGVNNVPTNTKTKDNLDNNTVYDNTIGDNSKTIAVNKTVADNSTATDNPGNSTNNVAHGENKTGSFLL